MQSLQRPIYNGTLESFNLIKYDLDFLPLIDQVSIGYRCKSGMKVSLEITLTVPLNCNLIVLDLLNPISGCWFI